MNAVIQLNADMHTIVQFAAGEQAAIPVKFGCDLHMFSALQCDVNN